MLDFNTEPYFDDFSEDNKFYRILFKPTVAVQARELNQIQSILQNQIKRHGDSIFKNGSMVVPGEFSVNSTTDYVTLSAPQSGDITDVSVLIGKTITDSSGLQALVINAIAAAGTDPAVLYISYSSSGTTQTYGTSTALTTVGSGTTYTVHSAAATPTGKATLATVNRGVYYINGHFVLTDKQTLVVDKFNALYNLSSLNTRVGFNVVEASITPDDIGYESLLDNSQGSPNYGAPGAHRFYIELQLALSNIGSSDPNFVELGRIVGQQLVYLKDKIDYSELDKTLARRTYDESGNYTVGGLDVDVREHRNNNRGAFSTSNAYVFGDVVTYSGKIYIAQGTIGAGGSNPDVSSNWISTTKPFYNNGIYDDGDISKLAIGVSPGKAYVQGFEIEKISTTYLDVPKPRTIATLDDNASISASVGSYVLVQNVHMNTASLLDFNVGTLVNLYDTSVTTPGTVAGSIIGTARVRGITFEYVTTTPAAQVARLYLFNVTMNSGYDFSRNVKSLGLSGISFTANLLTDSYSTQLSGTVSIAASTAAVTGIGTKFLSQLKKYDTIYFSNTAGTTVSGIVNTVTSDTSVTLFSNISTTPVTNSAVFLQLSSVVEPNNTSLVFPLPHTATKNLTDHSYWIIEKCTSQSSSSTTLTVTCTGTFEFDSSQFFVLNASGNQHDKVFTVSGSGSSATLDFGVGYAPSTSWKVWATVKRTGTTARKTKSLQTVVNEPFTIASGAAYNSTLTLANTDIVSIISVMSGGVDITSWYTLDNGQRDAYYGYGQLNLIPSSPIPTADVTVTYQYYSHGTGDFFDVASYPSYDTVGYYKLNNLRDCIDFRPDAAAGSTFSSFSIPRRGYNLQADITYYIGRSDKIAIDPQGNIFDIQGSASTTPALPDDPTSGMVLCSVDINPYCFTTSDVRINKIDNKRYTMRDIGKLEKRIDNLEYYTSLSLLEQETANLLITDSAGLNRFKNGFIVDNFSGHNVGDVTSQDYLCAIDMENNELRPFSSPENLDLVLSSTSTNYKLYGDLVTLPLDSTTPHVSIASNPYASRTEYVNPFAVFTFIGDIKMNPSSDDWFEVDRRPDIIRNEEGNFNSIAAIAEKAGVLGTVWNAWQNQWTGTTTTNKFKVQSGVHSYHEWASGNTGSMSTQEAIAFANNYWGGNKWYARTTTFQTTATQIGQSRTGVKTSLVAKVDTQTVDDKVLSTAVIPYIRSRNVLVQVSGLKPNTTFYPYFDNISVGSYVRPASIMTYTPIAGTFDTSKNVGDTLNTDTARRINGDSQVCLNIGDKITGGTSGATAIVVGKDVYTNPSTSAKTYKLHLVNVIGTFSASETFTGSLSGATGTYVSIVSHVTGDAITSTDSGNVCLLFNIPNKDSIKFRTGSREFKLIDNVSATGQFTSRARYNYNAQGILQTKQATVVATRNAELVEEAVTDNQVIIQSSTRAVADTGWWDPLAQSFLIDSQGGAFLSKVDLFFAAKDSNLPVTIEIREMVNGYPGKTVLPFSRVTIPSSQVNLSSNTVFDVDGTSYPKADTATTIEFPSPVYVMDKTEYALVVMSDSNAYKLWISQVGDFVPNTTIRIAEQPYNGVLFKSQNASTWTADQMQDMTFNLYRANFNTGVSASVVMTNGNVLRYNLEQDPFQTLSGSTTVRVWHKNHGFIAGNSVQYKFFNTSGIEQSSATVNGAVITANSNYTISNVQLDCYTIVANNAATSTGYAGGSLVYATRNIRFETIQPNINVLNFSDTSVSYTLTSTKYADGSSLNTPCIVNDNNYFLASQVATSATDSLKVTATMASSNPALSPVLDTERCSAILVANKIDKPSEGNSNVAAIDGIQLFATAQSCTMTTTTITPAGVNASIVKRIIPGSYISFTGASTLNGTKILVSSVSSTGVITVSGVTLTAETANLIITNYNFYVDEITPVGSSSTSKYVSKQITLAQQSTTIRVKLAACVPNEANILVYYKTGTSGTDLSQTNWVLLPSDKTLPKTSIDSDTFYDVDYTVSNLALFDRVMVKIVLQSSNTAAVPRVKDLRIIACA